MSDFTGCRTQGTFQNINIQLHAVAFSSEYFADASVNILTFISLLNISTEYCTLVYLQIQPAMHNDTLAHGERSCCLCLYSPLSPQP